MLKITSYGLHAFKHHQKTEKDMGEYEKYRKMLWTAPELLRQQYNLHLGTQKGDVYSLSIIIQEILFRAMPYFTENIDPKGKV